MTPRPDPAQNAALDLGRLSAIRDDLADRGCDDSCYAHGSDGEYHSELCDCPMALIEVFPALRARIESLEREVVVQTEVASSRLETAQQRHDLATRWRSKAESLERENEALKKERGRDAAEMLTAQNALRPYLNCRHASIDCPCTKEARLFFSRGGSQ